MRVTIIQVAYGDSEPVAERIERVSALVSEQRNTDLVVLPELWAHGGFAFSSWADRAETMDGLMVSSLRTVAKEIGVTVHAGSLIERADPGSVGSALGPQGRGLWNTSVLIGPNGDINAVYRKIHRFGFGAGETLLIEAGDTLVTAPLLGRDGRHLTTLGLATCYDLRFPEMFRRLSNADVVVVPAAWPAPRLEHWRVLGRARAIENQCVIIQCNTAGSHAGQVMGGHSQAISPEGVVLAEAGDSEEVLTVDVDLEQVSGYRTSFPVLQDRRF